MRVFMFAYMQTKVHFGVGHVTRRSLCPRVRFLQPLNQSEPILESWFLRTRRPRSFYHISKYPYHAWAKESLVLPLQAHEFDLYPYFSTFCLQRLFCSRKNVWCALAPTIFRAIQQQYWVPFTLIGTIQDTVAQNKNKHNDCKIKILHIISKMTRILFDKLW